MVVANFKCMNIVTDMHEIQKTEVVHSRKDK